MSELRRGIDTWLGEAGVCLHCGLTMRDGEPDACLGMIPGLIEACCGHGKLSRTYATDTSGTSWFGAAALPHLGRPAWPAEPPRPIGPSDQPPTIPL